MLRIAFASAFSRPQGGAVSEDVQGRVTIESVAEGAGEGKEKVTERSEVRTYMLLCNMC